MISIDADTFVPTGRSGQYVLIGFVPIGPNAATDPTASHGRSDRSGSRVLNGRCVRNGPPDQPSDSDVTHEPR